MMRGASSPCGSCGACCRSYVVPLFGDDVWRLSTGLRLAPEQFVLAYPQAAPSSEAFLLQANGPPLGLALDKQGRFRDTQPCVFLVELGGGQSRCGAYTHRPVVCRGYPMSLLTRTVSQRADALCPPESWPVETTALDPWRPALQQLRMSWDIYAEVAARWNARVSASSPDRDFGLHEYLAYVLNVYDRIDRLNRELGERTLAAVLDEWPMPPREPLGPADVRWLRDRPWWRYLERTRAIIDGFFPQCPALPYVMLSGEVLESAAAVGSR